MFGRVSQLLEQTGIANDWRAVREAAAQNTAGFEPSYEDRQGVAEDIAPLVENWLQGDTPEDPWPHFQFDKHTGSRAIVDQEIETLTKLVNQKPDPITELYLQILLKLSHSGHLDIETDICEVVEKAYGEDGVYTIPERYTTDTNTRDELARDYRYRIIGLYSGRLMKIFAIKHQPHHEAKQDHGTAVHKTNI
ncbi:MAG: hypothetical protein U0520_05525 [Candidatus Saccharimonadales bacterium]